MSKEFFNQKAEVWDEMADHNSDKISQVVRELPDFDNPEILDVGSGTGVMVPFLKERYGQEASITVIDFAENMIQVSKRKHRDYKNITYIIDDIFNYNFKQKYDLIICYSVFPHFKDKKEILTRLKSLLKSNGHLLIFHSQSRQAINNMHRKAGQEVKDDNLPAAERVVEIGVEMGFSPVRTVDSDQLYVVEFK